MAKCDQGYRCELCGQPVPNMIDSSLYLRYVLGEVQLHELFGAPERHLKCDHELSQYIVHEKFTQPVSNGHQINEPEQQRTEKEKRITAGWLRLREVVGSNIPITDYPMP